MEEVEEDTQHDGIYPAALAVVLAAFYFFSILCKNVERA